MSKQAAKIQELRLVEVHGQKLTTTSLVIAEQFGRKHSHVLKSLDKLVGRYGFVLSSYVTLQNKVERMYILDERQFLIVMPFIGGKKSIDGQERLVDEFLRINKILTEPGRKSEIQHKRDTLKPMTDMLKFVRETIGKSAPNVNHYGNESLLCNRALTGKWEPIDEPTLDVYDTRLLAAIRNHNTLLITRFPANKERKEPLDKFVAEYRIKHPRLMLVGNGESL